MAKKETLELDVRVRGDDDVKDLAEGLEDTEKAADKAAAAIVQMGQKIDSELRESAAAADALAQALGPELTAKTDVTSMVADLQKMGLTLEDIRTEADTLATALKQVDDIKMQGLKDGIDFSDASMRRLGSSSDQSRSVLANLAGNAAQDLGQLGGVVGSLGVGIGQMAEYAVDGNIAMSNLAKVAGPMAGLSAALFLVQQYMAGIAKQKAFEKENVDDFTASMREGADAAEALGERIEETGQLGRATDSGFLDLGTNIQNMIPLMNDLGITFDVFMDLVRDSGSIDRFNDQAKELWNTNREQAETYLQLADTIKQYQDLLGTAGVNVDELNTFLGIGADSMTEMNAAMTDLNSTTALHNTLWGAVINDLADGTLETANARDAWNQLAAELGLTKVPMTELAQEKLDEKLQADADAAAEAAAAIDEMNQELAAVVHTMDDAARRSDAFGAALEGANQDELDLQQTLLGFVDGLDAVGEAFKEAADAGIDFATTDLVPETMAKVRDMPEELRPVGEALLGLRDTIQEDLQGAFAGGGAGSLRESVAAWTAGVTEEIQQLGLSAEDEAAAIKQTLEALGLTDTQIDLIIATSGEEQARAVIGNLQGLIGGFDPTTQLAISVLTETAPIDALKLTIATLEQQGVSVPVELYALVDQFDADVAGATEPRTQPVAVDDGGTVDEFAGAADEATEDRTTNVIVPKSPTLGQMQTLIDHVARARTVNFIVTADNAGAVDGLLNVVARDRDSNIHVSVPNYAGVNGLLNTLARDRDSTIHVHTVHSSSGSSSGGGGATTFAAPAVAPAGVAPLTAAPAALSVAPTAVMVSPAVGAAPVTNNLHVTVQAAVVGNRHEVERTVAKALRAHVRLNGSRN